jgi:hypothetical protein
MNWGSAWQATGPPHGYRRKLEDRPAKSSTQLYDGSVIDRLIRAAFFQPCDCNADLSERKQPCQQPQR